MNLRQAAVLLIAAWLSGCAATERLGKAETTAPGETSVTEETADTRSERMNSTSAAEQAPVDAATTAGVTQALTLSRLLERLDRVATLEPGSMKQQIQLMNARYKDLSPADRYEFALLITRKSTNRRSLNRAISILDDLQESVHDRIVAEILLLHRRNFVLRKQYRSQRSKSIELEKKIERLKGLEQDLDKSNSRMQESSTPAPDEVQQP
ncbi:MAG: hypothetical protein AB2598_04325 [Candidatus Thiodiazotropha sp.]